MTGVAGTAVLTLTEAPASATPPAPTWATGQYFAAIQNQPFCDDVSISNTAALPLTSITVGATPSGITNYKIQDVDLTTGTAQVCGTDTNTPVSSGTPPTLAPVATNAGGSATDNIPIGVYGSCSWTSGSGTVKLFDAKQDLYQTGSQSSFGAAISNGETLGSTSNYATCTDAMVAENGSGESGGEGDAWTVNTANPLPTPIDSNPSANQGDLASSNLFLNSGGCYGAVNILSSYSYTNFGSGTSLTTPSPWVNGGECKYGSLGDNEAGGNTDSFATCPPTQADVNAGLVSCTIIASSGNNFNGSINYSTDDLFYTGQPVPQTSTATLSTPGTAAGDTVTVTGGSNWWGSSEGAPNTGPYGDDQNGDGSFYQVSAPSVYIGTTRSSAVPVDDSTVAISPVTYACTGAESSTVGPNPCTFTAGSPSGSFQVPPGLSPGVYNVYIDESNTTPLPGNGPNDTFQTTRGTSLGTVESASQLVVGTAPGITSAASTTFTAGSPGSFTVTTSGSPAPALTESGSLPSGVTFTDNGDGTGTLAGTPAAGTGGTYQFTIGAANEVSPDASQTFTLTVDQAPSITSADAATFIVGSAGSFTMTTTGVPTAALSESGVLPSGVGFVDNGNGTGTLSGTPAAGTSGSYEVTLGASNGVSPDAAQNFTLTVDVSPTITSSPTTTFTAGSPGSFLVTTTGNPNAALTESGSLPSGVTFADNGDGTGTLAGTPAPGTGGSYPVSITAANGVSPNDTQSFTLVVDQAPAVTSAAATTFDEGASGSFTVTTSGVPTAALSESGALPEGVTFADNGNGTATLSGTPAAGTRGSYVIGIDASNGVSPDGTQSFTLTVDAAPGITSAATTTFTAGSAGSFTVTTAGNPAPVLSKTGVLPSGVTFTDNGDGTATLAGTPAAGTGGSYQFTIKAANGVSPNATQSFTLVVDQAPAITSTASTTFTEGVTSSFKVLTTGNPAPGLTESGTLPNGVTFTDNGNGTASLAGDPAQGGTFPITITADNGVGSSADQSFTLTVTSTSAAPAITSASSETVTEGAATSFTVTSTGTPTPDLTETGALPSGIAFTDNGDGTASLAGTATSNGTYPITITASNGVNPAASQSFTLTVIEAPAITSASSTSFLQGSAGSFTVTSVGYPIPAFTKSGTLPTGVTFTDNGDGTATLSGTPAAGTTGSYPITIKAANGINPGASQSFTLAVDQVPAITSAASTTFTTGSSSTFTVTSTGFPTPTVSESGTLPSGVSFVAHTNGTASLTGTPAAGSGGVYAVSITASNGVSPDATQSLVLTVDAAPAITSAASTTFVVGSAGTFTVTSTAYPTAAMSESGALPGGVSFVDNGDGTATLAGTSTARGSYPITVTAANGVGRNATQSFTLVVDQAPSITSGSSVGFTVGSAGTFTVTTSGRPVAALTETGALPSGVTFTDNGNGTANLEGTPAAATGGSYPITITATNGVSPAASQSFTLTVGQAPAVTSASEAAFGVQSAGTFTVRTTGYPTAALSATGSLPSGVTFTDNGNGTATLAGTPAAGTGGSYPLTIAATNGVSPNASQSFTLVVGTAPAITSADAVTAPLGSPMTFHVTATGDPTPTITASGVLPKGVTFSAGTLSGTPKQAGAFEIGLVASNGVSPSAVQDFSLTVSGLKVTTTSLPGGYPGGSYSKQLTASGGITPLKWTKSGALPKGLKLSKSGLLSGVLSGRVAAGTYTVSVKVSDASKPKQTVTATFHLTVTVN